MATAQRRAQPSHLGRWLAVVLLLVLAALAAVVFVVPGNLPAPPGSIRLGLNARAGLPISLGCPAVLLNSVIVAREGNALVLRAQLTGEVVEVSWPPGWTARELHGRAELVEPFGGVFAREGEILSNTLTGGVGVDEVFHICSTEPLPRPVIPTQGPADPI
jgi:hypothetical protein